MALVSSRSRGGSTESLFSQTPLSDKNKNHFYREFFKITISKSEPPLPKSEIFLPIYLGSVKGPIPNAKKVCIFPSFDLKKVPI